MLDIFANMAMVIPGYGVAIFGGLEATSRFAFPDDKEPSVSLAGTLQSTLKDCFDAQAFQKASNLCDEIAAKIGSARQIGLFKTANWSRKSEYLVSRSLNFLASRFATELEPGACRNTL